MPAKLTRQDKLDICKSYREAKSKDNQIGILSELYLVPQEEIRQILKDGGEIKKTRARKQPVETQPEPVEEKNKPGRIMMEIICQARDLLKTTEEEIQKLQRELREAEQDKKDLETLLQTFGEEIG